MSPSVTTPSTGPAAGQLARTNGTAADAGGTTGESTAQHQTSDATSEQQSRYRFQLFVMTENELTRRARRNLESILKQIDSTIDIEVIDVLQHPESALQSEVYVTPTLIDCGHNGHGRLIGDFSDAEVVRRFLLV